MNSIEPGKKVRRRRIAASFVTFVRTSRGATAVEFGLVAAPFIAMLVAILQVGVVLIAQAVLQQATTQAARLIMTGQAQTQNMSAAQFQNMVCTDTTPLFNCAGIYVNVRTYTTFGTVALNNPIVNGNFNAGSMQYNPGGPGDIVVAQTYYQWPVFLAPLGFNLSDITGNKLLIVGTAAFRNEPY
jgi:Flp pilus assembly protein TadG